MWPLIWRKDLSFLTVFRVLHHLVILLGDPTENYAVVPMQIPLSPL